MQATSVLTPRQREKPRIFSNTSKDFGISSINNSTSQSKLQSSLTQSFKSTELTDPNLFSSLKTAPSKFPSQVQQTLVQRPQSQVDKSVGLTLLKIENQKLKQENQKINQTVGKLRKQLTDKVVTLQKFNDLMKIKYSEIKTLKAEIQTKNNKINDLQNKNQQLLQQQNQNTFSNQASKIKQQYMLKSAQLDQLLQKINNLQHENFANQVFQMKISKLYDELGEQKTKSNQLLIQKSELSQKISQLKEKVQTLEYENKRIQTINKIDYQSEQIQTLFSSLNQSSASNGLSSSPTKQSKQSQHLNAFEEALKVQLKQIEELKKTIENSQQIIQSLRDNLITSRRELQELRGEMKIINLKQTTERKKLIMQYRLQIHEKDNEINNTLKKYKTLEEKYKTALNDIKAKDDFLKQHLVGRLTDITAQQYVDSVLKKYTQNFDELVGLKAQNAELAQKSQKYLKLEQQIESNLLLSKK